MSDNQASVYASFGVSNVVLSGENIEDHRQAMLEQDVDVRDGDDAITVTEHEDAGVVVTDLVNDPYGDTEGRVEVTINDDGTDSDETVEDAEGEPDGEPEAAADPEVGDVGDELPEPPEALVASSQKITEYADGFAQMRAQAITNGLSPEVAAKIEAEYTADSELSQESLDALAAAGFAPAFVKSFIDGQEAMATQYVADIVQYAGGKEQFDSLVAHLQTNSPDTIEVLEGAIQRQDLKAIKATINLAKASHKARFGKAPARTVTRAAPATKATSEAPKVEGFTSQEEMVKAMGDRRYQTDAKYRGEVQQKVWASNW